MSIMEKFKLNGKIALVTGCSKGIGFGIAKGLAEAGADIIGVSSTLDKGSDIEKYVESIGKKFHCFRCDFSKRQNTGGARSRSVVTYPSNHHLRLITPH